MKTSITPRTVCLVIVSLGAGGMERVMSLLASKFYEAPDVRPILILLTNQQEAYQLPSELEVIRPSFDHKEYSRFNFTIKIFNYLRVQLKRVKPEAILCFGGKYNAFSILATLGLGIKVFISERSRPGISYGKVLDFLNPIVYKKAEGIIAQTSQAKAFTLKQTGHKNIQIIANPVRPFPNLNLPKENIIINVGRFIKSKQQELLIELFSQINPPNWKLVFLGNGRYEAFCREKAKHSKAADRIIFLGHQTDIESYYAKSKIFAFTSISEGFPNALAEAMSAGLACISLDCNAGPADLIDNNENGFLIPIGQNKLYLEKLKQLLHDEILRERFGEKAVEKINKYHIDYISQKFKNFLLPDYEVTD